MISASCKAARRPLKAALLFLSLGIAAGTVYAETRRDAGGDDAVRKAQLLLRRMQAELQQVKAENAKLKAELDPLKKDRDGLKEELAGNERQLSRSRQSNAALTDRVRRDSDRYHTLMDRYRNTLARLRAAQFKVAYLTEAVTERNHWIEVCRENNAQLETINHELLDRSQNHGLFDALVESEPFTGLGQVRLENMVEEYRYRLDDLKVLDFPRRETPGGEPVASTRD